MANINVKTYVNEKRQAHTLVSCSLLLALFFLP